MELLPDDVLFAVARESVTLTIARSAPFKKKTETDVQRLSTWEVQKQIYSMSGKSMASKSDEIAAILH